MSLKFNVKEKCEGTPVKDLNGCAVFMHGGSFYRVVTKTGNGVSLKHSGQHLVIVNMKLGSLREIHRAVHVIPLEFENEEVNLCEISADNMHMYLKDNCR